MTYINNIYFNYIKLFNIIQGKGRKIMNDDVRKQRKEISKYEGYSIFL